MLQSARGTHDLLPSKASLFEKILSSFINVSKTHGYSPLQTPIFESTNLFSRTLGETSDVVNKEMYTFKDRSDESITLRPEGTASIVRAAIQHKLLQTLPLKTYYHGPMFRYERPQMGRYRQFHQLGVECLGAERHPYVDVEIILMAWEFLKDLGLNKKVALQINTLGSNECREKYKEILVEYFNKFKNDLSENSKERLIKNPLRILDSKDENDIAICSGAPKLLNSLSSESMSFFEKTHEGLDKLGVPYNISNSLVRGLDYYTHTVFEFVSKDLGAQGTVLAGGRYDHLVKELGGADMSGVGFAGGIDRIALLLNEDEKPSYDIAVLPVDSDDECASLETLNKLQSIGIKASARYTGQLSKRLKKEDKLGTKIAIIIGENERKNNSIILRNLKNSHQEELTLEMALIYLESTFSS
jgi:histidyl-tRNA synthetase